MTRERLTKTPLMKKISTFLLVAFACCCMASASYAQPAAREERIENLKIAFITEKLDLSVEESQRFWPLYNAFNKERKANKKTMREVKNKMKTTTSTQEMVQWIDQLAELKARDVKAEAEFTKASLPVLGIEKTKRLAQLEDEFKKEILQRLKERRAAAGGKQGGRE
jgi:peroxiredoxin family protein